MTLKQLLRPDQRSHTPTTREAPVARAETVGSTNHSQILHKLFEAQVDARPDAVAVLHGDESISYAGLERRANRLARHLRAMGIRSGSRVAILLPRSIDAYAALLGVLKAGAAYVPLDPDYPAERIRYILEDAAADALVTAEELKEKYLEFGGELLLVDADHATIAERSPLRLPHPAVGVSPEDLCYLIYTSGSTGRPKGVMIEHRSAAHLVQAEGRLYEPSPEDRVYQGASLCFDLSVEEIWLAFHSGATLVAATPQMACAGPDLAQHLTNAGVTVLSCVPTLLATLSDDVPTLRLLILGGEACPPSLVERWASPERRMINTYGPTEATVIATYAELVREQPVSVGRPIPGYRVYVLDDTLQLVPHGDVGEICIGGVGVARGYVGLAEENAARFVPDPFAPPEEADARLYRTGDLGRLDGDGRLECLGRLDGQVKLRGFRVELTEIESVLLHAEDLAAAACAVREDVPGIQQLVGYVVPRDGRPVDETQLRAHLRRRLPAFMVPALIETVDELPVLPSGKLDRSSLPPPQPRRKAPQTAGRRPHTDTECRITRVWEELFLFHPLPVGVDDDFFLDLGGHSLLAARAVSALRKEPRFARVSVTDIYHHPTIAALAVALDAVPTAPVHPHDSVAPSSHGERPGARARHFLAGVLQSCGLYFHYGVRALEWITPYLVYFILIEDEYSVLESAAWAALAAVLMFPALLAVAVAAKWLILGRIRPGHYPLWGGYYLRWWFAQGLTSAVPLDYLAGTPLLPFVYRLLGVRIGRNVHIGTDQLAAFDLISIGDGSSIDDKASLLGFVVEDEELVIGPVAVGRGCFVGCHSVLREHTMLEDGARMEDLSLLPIGTRIPAGETWAGSPARRAEPMDEVPAAPPAISPLRRALLVAMYSTLILIFPIVLALAIVPGMAILTHIGLVEHPLRYLAATPLVGASFVLLLSTEVVIFKWLLVGRVRAGAYPVHGSFYVRSWTVNQLMMLSLDMLGQLHATLYLAPWYRALGARLGRFVEFSTASVSTPDLLEIGDESTIADEVSLGPARIEGGWMTVAPTRLGRRVFLGNSAMVPAGVAIGDKSLVGVLSLTPARPGEAAQPGASWLGSPPILMPRRQPSADFPEQCTFRPTRKLWLTRGCFEILRVTLPPAGVIMVTASVILAMLALRDSVGLGSALLLLPLVYIACCAAAMALVALAKWSIMGRYKPFEQPLWSFFVWRLELVNALYEFFLTPLALDALHGTPLLPWYLRLLGVRIGRQVYMASTGFLEFDITEIGDRVALNDDCVMQTHLFQDRVLKGSELKIGNDCAVGAFSVVLYDTTMEQGSRLDALSLLMKGETLPAGTAWVGTPAEWRGARSDRDSRAGTGPGGEHRAQTTAIS